MSFHMELWEVEGKTLKQVSTHTLDFEERLEDWLAEDSSISGMDILIIGRQVQTEYGGRIDLLGIDSLGNTVIFELKRGRTPRDVVAQIVDYATWVKDLSYSDLNDITHHRLNKDLPTAFDEHYGVTLPDVINAEHTLIIVASELDESSERIVEYLSEKAGLKINVVFFNSFQLGNKELLGRAWFKDPIEIEEKQESTKRAPWSGYWFVNVGEGVHRNWEDCRNYGFLSAGQDDKYSKQLKRLRTGDKVFAYMKGLGYVGFGEITSESTMIRDFRVEGQPLLELSLKAEAPGQNSDNPKRSEWVLGVRWHKTYSRDNAKTFKNIFANQNIVCKLRDLKTVDFVEKQFFVEHTA